LKILQLENGLFPDEDGVRLALGILGRGEHTVSRIDAAQLAADDDAAWDAVVLEVLAADKVVTV
jgi:hypothetical protein